MKPLHKKIVAIGLVIIFALAIAGYLKTPPPKKDKVSAPSAAQSSMQKKIQAKLPAPKDKMIIPTSKEITGKWMTKFGKSSIAEINLVNQNFELIYTDDPQGRARKYSKGNYKYDESTGKITLYPSKKAGAPKPIAGVNYKRLTLRHYDIFISKESGRQDIYFSAPEFQIKAKNFHPLFLYADYKGAPVLKFLPVQIDKSK